MEKWQEILITIYGLLALTGSFKGFYESKRKNTLGSTGIFNIYGAFVWADMAIFGLFWFLASSAALFVNDWILFLLTLSAFWLVRAIGETLYWFNQQFSTINRNPIKDKWLRKLFPDEYTVWFVFQIYWQCLIVIALVATIYLVKIWR